MPMLMFGSYLNQITLKKSTNISNQANLDINPLKFSADER